MAPPTRRRGLGRKRRGLEALVNESSRTTTNTYNQAQTPTQCLAHDDDSPIYQGDFFGPKKSSHMRLVCLNLNNLPIDIDEPKEVSLFQAILEHEIDVLLL